MIGKLDFLKLNISPVILVAFIAESELSIMALVRVGTVGQHLLECMSVGGRQ